MEIHKNMSLVDLPNEEWRDVIGYEGLYQVSNLGRVKRLEFVVMRKNGRPHTWKTKIVAQFPRNGYLRVPIEMNKKKMSKVVHRIVAFAFIPNPCGYKEINHKDENKSNNCIDNLEWCDRSYNCSYGSLRDKMSEYFKGKPKQRTKIYQYDLEGNLIRVWDSMNQIKKNGGFSLSCIREVCKGKRKTAKGYKWSFNQL